VAILAQLRIGSKPSAQLAHSNGYFSPNTSRISNKPDFLPSRKRAARIAPSE
jgi:hypothetical protein